MRFTALSKDELHALSGFGLQPQREGFSVDWAPMLEKRLATWGCHESAYAA